MKSFKKRKGIGYCRVSGTSQKDNFSLKAQGDDIQRYYDSKGIALDTMLTDVGSGLSIKQRPNFKVMIPYSLDNKNGITDIAFWELDRFTRNIEEFFTYTNPLLEAGITLHLITDEEEFDYNSADKWYQKLVEAQKESKRISKRTKRGQRAATQDGRHLGNPPWGYKLKHDTDEKDFDGMPVLCGRLVKNLDIWDDVLEFWRLAESGLTPKQLSGAMNRLNIPAPGGEEWTDAAARTVIKNPKYYGLMFRGVNPQSRIPGPKENTPPIIIEKNHKRAVDYATWKKINDAMEKRSPKKGSTRVHSSPNPASGKLKCGPCMANGYVSNLEIHRKKDATRLRCSRKKKIGDYDCGFKTPRLDRVLEALMDRLRNHFLTKDTLQNVTARIADESRSYLEKQETNKAGVRERRTKVRDGISNLKKTLRKGNKLGPRSLRSITEDLEKLLTEEEELDQVLAGITSDSEEARLFVNNPEGIIETALDLNTYTNPEDLEAVRELIDLFIDRVELMDNDTGVIYYDFPVHGGGSEDESAEETIYFGKKTGLLANKSCGFAICTGLGWG